MTTIIFNMARPVLVSAHDVNGRRFTLLEVHTPGKGTVTVEVQVWTPAKSRGWLPLGIVAKRFQLSPAQAAILARG